MAKTKRFIGRRPSLGLWLLTAGVAWVMLLVLVALVDNVPASSQEPRRIVIGGLARDVCTVTPDAPVWAAD